MKKCIMVGYEEEKLMALRMYAEQKGISIEDELAQAAETLYQKIVPGNVKAFLDMKSAAVFPFVDSRFAFGFTVALIFYGVIQWRQKN